MDVSNRSWRSVPRPQSRLHVRVSESPRPGPLPQAVGAQRAGAIRVGSNRCVMLSLQTGSRPRRGTSLASFHVQERGAGRTSFNGISSKGRNMGNKPLTRQGWMVTAFARDGGFSETLERQWGRGWRQKVDAFCTWRHGGRSSQETGHPGTGREGEMGVND